MTQGVQVSPIIKSGSCLCPSCSQSVSPLPATFQKGRQMVGFGCCKWDHCFPVHSMLEADANCGMTGAHQQALCVCRSRTGSPSRLKCSYHPSSLGGSTEPRGGWVSADLGSLCARCSSSEAVACNLSNHFMKHFLFIAIVSFEIKMFSLYNGGLAVTYDVTQVALLDPNAFF